MKNKINKFIVRYLKETQKLVDTLSVEQLIRVIAILNKVKKDRGRAFILGVGGSAANASHCVNDLRKIAGIEAYTPIDNVAELTAWTNDNGFEFAFSKWLKTSRLNKRDVLIILSVGGGSASTSQNLVLAMRDAQSLGTPIISIVSRNGGYAKKASTECIHIPELSDDSITPHAEEFQGIIWHLLVNAMVKL